MSFFGRDGFMPAVHPQNRIAEFRLGAFHTHEVKDISVKEVTETKSFDDLGHPVVGGLYDPVFGPVDQEQPCPTCGLFQKDCPGHMGYIRLPLPAFNPVLFTLTFKVVVSFVQLLSYNEFIVYLFRFRSSREVACFATDSLVAARVQIVYAFSLNCER